LEQWSRTRPRNHLARGPAMRTRTPRRTKRGSDRGEFFGRLRPKLRQAERLYPGRSTNKPLSRSSRPSHSVMLPQCCFTATPGSEKRHAGGTHGAFISFSRGRARLRHSRDYQGDSAFLASTNKGGIARVPLLLNSGLEGLRGRRKPSLKLCGDGSVGPS